LSRLPISRIQTETQHTLLPQSSKYRQAELLAGIFAQIRSFY